MPVVLVAGCGDDSAFTLGRSLQVCEGTVPSCNTSARCVLGSDQYLSGTFPAARSFIVRTDGEVTIKFQLFLNDQRSPGSELRLTTFEPGCGERYVFDTGGQDIFRLTRADGILPVPIHVVRGGDHLVQLVADANCSFTLIWDPSSAG